MTDCVGLTSGYQRLVALSMSAPKLVSVYWLRLAAYTKLLLQCWKEATSVINDNTATDRETGMIC